MPSVRPFTRLALGTGVVVSLAGCTTTQTTAARERLESAREVAAQTSTVVARPGGVVAVTATALVTGGPGSRSAVVVSLRNDTARALSDLPISVGYRVGSRQRYLNNSASLTYFQSHLGAIGAHGRATWIFTTSSRLPAGARAFARVGSTPTVDPGTISATPALAVGTGALRAGTLEVRVRNRSSIAQTELPVYAWGTRKGRIVAAGVGSISNIDSGSIKSVEIALTGNAGASLHVESLPTTFR